MIKRVMIALLLLLALLGLAAELAEAARGTCSDEGNLTINCDMDTFSDHSSGNDIRIVADGWWFWVEEGNAAFDVGQDSTVPPSQRIWSDGGNFRVGIYQQISNLTPGATYIAGANWLPYTSPDGSIMRQIGLDPAGGTEPNASTVLWGPEDWKFSRFTNLEQTAVATGTRMTIFIRIYNPASHGADQIFIDGAWMKQDTSIPVQTAATATALPPTPTVAPIHTPIPAEAENCLFFTETSNGQGSFSLCDDAQARFRAAFQQWGLQRIGYPISRRYMRDGFVTQAFQKSIMQWRPETNSVALVNIFDDLHNAGFDARLLNAYQTPMQLPAGWDGDSPFEEVVQKRQALLNERSALREAYFAAFDPLIFYGLPTSLVSDMGNHYAIRLQRSVLQEWKQDVPWAKAGEVTIANGGDIGKTLGALPVDALIPE
jgi:hypothetical protein